MELAEEGLWEEEKRGTPTRKRLSRGWRPLTIELAWLERRG